MRKLQLRFNTASGMRSHVTKPPSSPGVEIAVFQYRKRYEVTCDLRWSGCSFHRWRSFNTASGMRSHVTWMARMRENGRNTFQYRKRYEVTCDETISTETASRLLPFQYRKRYEVTCDMQRCMAEYSTSSFNTASGMRSHVTA